MKEYHNDVLEQIKDDPFVRLCWQWTCLKIGVLAVGFVGVFLYVVIKCAIDKL